MKGPFTNSAVYTNSVKMFGVVACSVTIGKKSGAFATGHHNVQKAVGDKTNNRVAIAMPFAVTGLSCPAGGYTY